VSISLNSQSTFGFHFPAWPVWVLGSFLACIHLVFLANQSASFFADLGGFERNVVWTIQHKLLGGNVYENPKATPFSITQYGPAYYYLISGIASIFGILADNYRAVIQLGRFTNLFIILALAIGVFQFAIRQLKASKFAAFFSSLLAFLILGQQVLSGRPDALKAGFTLLSIFAAFNYLKTTQMRWQMAVFGFASAALLTKQDGIIAFFPLFIFHFFNKSSALEWLKSTGIAAIYLILIAALLFTHPFASYNLIDGLKNGLSLSWFLSVFQGFFGYLSIVLLLAVLGLFKLADTHKPSAILLGSYLAVYFLFPCVFALKYGSGTNYFNEAMLISSIAIVPLMESMLIQRPKHSYLILFGFLLCFQSVSTSRELVSLVLGNQSELKKQYNSQLQIASWLRQHHAPKQAVLCLISRQWEDHFTNLAPELVIVPQRDVMDQVFKAAPNSELAVSCKTHLLSQSIQYIVTDKSIPPMFLNVNFVPNVPVFEVNGYKIFENPVAK